MVQYNASIEKAQNFWRQRPFSIVAVMMSSSRNLVSPSGGPVVLSGHVKKLKTQKKKFFVLRGEAPGYPACLEYYDSKKKFENRQLPKRSILLNSCFNINRRMDTKHKHVIALYTKDECFCLILESEKELDEWLKAMLLLQSGDVADGEQPRPIFGNTLLRFELELGRVLKKMKNMIHAPRNFPVLNKHSPFMNINFTKVSYFGVSEFVVFSNMSLSANLWQRITRSKIKLRIAYFFTNRTRFFLFTFFKYTCS